MELREKLGVAWARVQKDRSTDFVIGDFEYLVYGAHSEELLDLLTERVEAGVEFGSAPLRTIRVPKDARSHTTRPGAVPEIDERIVYQMLVDDLADAVEPSLVPVDERVVHSYRYAGERDSAEMFLGFRHASYATFQERALEIAAAHPFLVVADISDFYERVYHHVLENLLRGLGAPNDTVTELMALLRRMRRGSSYGIPQGVWASDYVGNLYLDSLDKLLLRRGLSYCRFVDDIRIGVESAADGERVIERLQTELEAIGLSLNAGKTTILPQADVEGTLVPHRARLTQVSEALRTAWLAASPYEINPEELPAFDEAVTVAAIIELFREQMALRSSDASILRFCVRQFRILGVDQVLDEILDNLDRLVVVTQAIVPYLVKMADEANKGAEVVHGVSTYLRGGNAAYDWQVMWLLQLLYRITEVDEASLVFVRNELLNGRRSHDAVTASAVLLLGRHGDHADRESLMRRYDRETSVWVKRAILFRCRRCPDLNATTSISTAVDSTRLLTE